MENVSKWVGRLLLGIGVIGVVIPFTPLGLPVGLWFDPDAFKGAAELGAPKPIPELASIGNIALPAFGGYFILRLLRAASSRWRLEPSERREVKE
jgi:hypothetical protein